MRSHFDLFSLSLPGLIYILIFAYLPMFGVVLAFKKFRYDLGIWNSEWVGLRNFEFFFKSDVAWQISKNTVLYGISFWIITTAMALIFAILLNELTKRWIKVHQTILFLPHFVSWIIVAYLVEGFLHHDYGFLNGLLNLFGLEPVSWYRESHWWPYLMNLVSLWKGVGFGTLIYYAGIMGIDPHLYEAARMDGANRRQMALRITIPMLAPLIVILMILSIGNIFSADFGLFYFVPKNSVFLYPATDVINTYVYRALTEIGDIGMSAAVGLFQAVVGLVLVVSANYAVRKINEENALW